MKDNDDDDDDDIDNDDDDNDDDDFFDLKPLNTSKRALNTNPPFFLGHPVYVSFYRYTTYMYIFLIRFALSLQYVMNLYSLTNSALKFQNK